MFTKKITIRSAGATLVAIVLLTAQPLRAQSASDTARIDKLEQAVEMLQKQNAQLKAEVSSLKKHPASASAAVVEGPTKTEVVYDGKTYVEKVVPAEKSSADKWKLSTSITEMELYGDVRLRYQYNGGETKDRGPVARLVRASQEQTIGRSASASVIVFALACVERLWTIGSLACGWRPATTHAQQT